MVSGGADLRAASRASAADVAGAAAGARADAASGGRRGRSTTFRGATDAPRDGDMRGRRDCRQRQSWWVVTPFRARALGAPRLNASRELQRVRARMQLAAGHEVAAR